MTIRTDGEGGGEAIPADDLRHLETPADSTEPVIETRERPAEEVATHEDKKPELKFGSPSDRKRQEINERFQRQQEERGAKIERSDDAERMMGGHNLQTRGEREAEAAAAAEEAAKPKDAPVVKAEDVPAPKRVVLNINGQDREFDESQVRNYAQISVASQDILNEAKRERDAAREERRLASQELADIRQLRADHSRSEAGQPTPTQTKAEDTKPATDEELDDIIDAIQTGDVADAKKALSKYGDQIERRMMDKIGNIDERIAATTRRQQEDVRVHNETNKVITDFLAENDDFSSHPMRGKALIEETAEVMRENLIAIGVKDETIANIARAQGIAPQVAVGVATRMLRQKGYDLPDGPAVMKVAASRVREGFGLPDPAPRQEAKPAPVPAVDSTSSILAERDARKAAMAPQPRRANVSPGPDLAPAKSKEELAREHVRAVKVSRRRY